MGFSITNTMGLQARAQAGGRVRSADELRDAWYEARRADLNLLALGEGSNIIPAPRINAYACVVDIPGIREIERDESSVSIEVGAGQNWHELVCQMHAEKCYGLENLALIPGSVGAAPVQNIGAYGVELDQFVTRVEAMESSGRILHLTAAECEFAYRDSRFKRTQTDPENALVILRVTLKLRRVPSPVLSYPELARRVEPLAKERDLHSTSSRLLEAVIQIRQEKLPDPQTVPNTGSFFKNPLVSREKYRALKSNFAQLVGFEQPIHGTDDEATQADTNKHSDVKLSAAQLIDLAGWKDRGAATVSCWTQQPLVIVNNGSASHAEVMDFAEAIRLDISQRFGVRLEPEPRLLA